MQGVSVLTDAKGQPSFLAVDLINLNPAIRPMVEQLLERVQQAEEAAERADWQRLAAANLERAYGEDEPDYSDVPPRN